MNPAVHKFGGAALANARAIRHAVNIVTNGQRRGVVVVASAMGGVTDALLEICTLAKQRDRARVEKAIATLRERHVEAANDLTSETKTVDALVAVIERELDELARLARRVAAAPKRLTPA
ncbi:MAG TPA: hypothetical protein VFD67_15595, partial [Gemmatimonadaceae bacterium]|nr:hypothetical protein [Gemmatimonadaceae bacterium]